MFDASSKIPNGILQGNLVDLGNYDQCLSISHEIPDDHTIKGKYCQIKIPLPPEISSTKEVKKKIGPNEMVRLIFINMNLVKNFNKIQANN